MYVDDMFGCYRMYLLLYVCICVVNVSLLTWMFKQLCHIIESVRLTKSLNNSLNTNTSKVRYIYSMYEIRTTNNIQILENRQRNRFEEFQQQFSNQYSWDSWLDRSALCTRHKTKPEYMKEKKKIFQNKYEIKTNENI